MASLAGKKLNPSHFVRTVWNSFKAESGLEGRLFARNLRVLRATEGFVDMELTIAPHHTNRLKILHGGAIASLVDLGGSLAVASKGYFGTGVSTDLNVSYLNNGGISGNKVRVTATCDKIGKTLAFTRVNFYDQKNTLIARGSHTKYIAVAIQGNQPFELPEEAIRSIEERKKKWEERMAQKKETEGNPEKSAERSTTPAEAASAETTASDTAPAETAPAKSSSSETKPEETKPESQSTN
ncbi:hypothetical protein VTJ04DRAFT_6872 [Mycothermus thermophilus]|uniref:uncharacterized protein n=1 Tax=Humicola insolens TaxID=85995 RepID=UPI0037428215